MVVARVQNLLFHYHPAQLFRAVCLGLIAGAVLVVGVTVPAIAALALLAVAATVAWRLPKLRLVALAVAGVAVFLLRGSGLPPQPTPTFIGHQVFQAQVVAPPQVGEKAVRYEVALASGVRVLLVTKLIPSFGYGDTLQVTCDTLAPTTFVSYQAVGIMRECAFPELQLLTPGRPSFTSWLLQVRATASERLRTVVPEPYASLATGILWGDDAGLPADLAQAFKRTGTSHITAASGYNVMVVTEILFGLLVSLGLWRKQASLGVLVAVTLFVVFSGAEPAVVRAGIMGGLLVVGRLLGRRADNLNLLVGAAAAMLLVSPWLWSNLGFQLSFASMLGLMYVGPRLTPHLTWLTSVAGIRESAAQTLSAIAATVPIVLVRLGTLSLVAPLANLAIAPALVFVYVLALGLLPLAFVAQTLAVPVGAGLTLVLAYISWVVDRLAALPWATAGSWFAWVLALVGYGGLGWWFHRASKSAV